MEQTKKCLQCGEEKLFNEFNKHKLHSDGLSSQCKICIKENKKCFYLNHKEKIKTKVYKYYLDNLKKVRQKQNIYRLENRDFLNQNQKSYYLEFPWKRTLYNILQRCNNTNNTRYKDYGGRGIKCLITADELKELWFRDNAYLMERPSIDRIDNDGNYEISNCQYLEMNDNLNKRHNEQKLKSRAKNGF